MVRLKPRKDQRDILISLLSQIRSVDAFRLKLPEGLPPLNRYLAFMEPVGPDAWIDENTDEVVSTADAISRYSTLLPPQFLKFLDLPEWLRSFVECSDCRLIETQRLLRVTRPEEALRQHRRTYVPPRPVVDVEAKDLAGGLDGHSRNTPIERKRWINLFLAV
jgi:hypothetical protein